MKPSKLMLAAVFFITANCAVIESVVESTDPGTEERPASSGNVTIPPEDPQFAIVSHSDSGFGSFDRKVDIFGIPIYAAPDVEDHKFLHAANIMAQYLDNDEDGFADNPRVLDAMLDANAFMVMWADEADLDDVDPPNNAEGQDLGNDETMPGWHTNGHSGRFDAALEEVWHIITHAGYANAYPDVFGEQAGSALADAMDTARGGRFTQVPDSYPAGAWYTYNDRTCDYSCMVTEYFYWAMTSMLVAQENRLDEIEQEWNPNTRALVQAMDAAVYDLLTDAQYGLPTVLPDGTYGQ